MQDLDNDGVSNAYARLIEAEHQLLKSELAVETKKSANFESLLADGHASWLENRQQRLVVDILKAKMVAYEQFESEANGTLTGGEMNFGATETNTNEMRLEIIQELEKELASLRTAEEKLATGIVGLQANDPWVEGYRLRHARTVSQADVVAAKISLLKQMNALQDESNQSPEIVSTENQAGTFTAAWKKPAKDSSFTQLLISQAELQIQLSEHHLLNETQRLASLQGLADRGMATERSVMESKKNFDAVTELLKDQRDSLGLLREDEGDSPDVDIHYTSVESSAEQPNLPVLQSVLNQFELGQTNYLKREAILKGEMYRDVLRNLEQAVAVQENQTKYDATSSEFSDVLIRGQQREMEQYRWKIKKTELQRDLADAQIALLKDSDGSQSDNVNMLVSAVTSSSIPATLPSRFMSNDPFGLQTTYSAFVFNSPTFKARRPSLATRGALSSSFRPVINRNALSYYRDLQTYRSRSSFGGFNRGHSFGYIDPRFRRPGQPPFFLPGSPSGFSGTSFGTGSFGSSRFGNQPHFNSFGRSSQFHRSSGRGLYGR